MQGQLIKSRAAKESRLSSSGFLENYGYLWLIALVLWGYLLRYPSVSYPAGGSLVLGLQLAFAAWVARLYYPWVRQQPVVWNPACWAGVAIAGWIGLRWAADGFPGAGIQTFMTLGYTVLWAATVFMLLGLSSHYDKPRTAASPNLVIMLAGVSIAALLCGSHACVQYLWLYERSYHDLLKTLAGAEPTPLQAGLLHHFKLRRVVSVWGDPNSLAAFCAMSMPASIELLRVLGPLLRGSRRIAASACVIVVAGSILLAGIGIVLSGSRGGILDALLVVVLYLFARWTRVPGGAACLIAACCLAITSSASAADAPRSDAWTWRSNTIRERVHYAQVGMKMISARPLAGMGIGSVDLYFGRYKSIEARETKYLHNWVLQIGAEAGVIAVALALTFLTLLFCQCRHLWRTAAVSTMGFVIMALVFVMDALVQLSFNQRELMSLFGISCGVLLHAGRAPAQHGWQRVGNSANVAGVLVIMVLLGLFGVKHLVSQGQVQIAHDAMDAGEWEIAGKYLDKARKYDPRNPRILLDMAALQERQGLPQEAKTSTEKAIQLQPESASARASLSHALEHLGSPLDQVLAAMNEALIRYPGNADYNQRMAILLHRAGDTDKALEHARTAVQVSTGLPFEKRYRDTLRTLESQTSGTEVR